MGDLYVKESDVDEVLNLYGRLGVKTEDGNDDKIFLEEGFHNRAAYVEYENLLRSFEAQMLIEQLVKELCNLRQQTRNLESRVNELENSNPRI